MCWESVEVETNLEKQTCRKEGNGTSEPLYFQTIVRGLQREEMKRHSTYSHSFSQLPPQLEPAERLLISECAWRCIAPYKYYILHQDRIYKAIPVQNHQSLQIFFKKKKSMGESQEPAGLRWVLCCIHWEPTTITSATFIYDFVHSSQNHL